MAYTINRFSGTELTVVTDSTIDETLNIKLIGKNYAGYGEMQNENFVFLLENFAGKAQPSRPLSGQLWFDTDNNRLKFYDVSSQFRSLAGINIQAGTPTGSGSTLGEFWYDTSKSQLHAWNGSNFTLIGPVDSDIAGTAMRLREVYDTANSVHLALEAVVGGVSMFLVSKDGEFTLATTTDTVNVGLSAYVKLFQGVNLPASATGKTTTGTRYRGTATHAEDSDKLAGYVPTWEANASTVVLRTNDGDIFAKNGTFSGSYVQVPVSAAPSTPATGMIRCEGGKFWGYTGSGWTDFGATGGTGVMYDLTAGGNTAPFIQLAGSDTTTREVYFAGTGTTTVTQAGSTITINSIGGSGGGGATYDLQTGGGAAPYIRLLGSDASADDITFSGGGDVTLLQEGNNIRITSQGGSGGTTGVNIATVTSGTYRPTFTNSAAGTIATTLNIKDTISYNATANLLHLGRLGRLTDVDNIVSLTSDTGTVGCSINLGNDCDIHTPRGTNGLVVYKTIVAPFQYAPVTCSSVRVGAYGFNGQIVPSIYSNNNAYLTKINLGDDLDLVTGASNFVNVRKTITSASPDGQFACGNMFIKSSGTNGGIASISAYTPYGTKIDLGGDIDLLAPSGQAVNVRASTTGLADGKFSCGQLFVNTSGAKISGTYLSLTSLPARFGFSWEQRNVGGSATPFYDTTSLSGLNIPIGLDVVSGIRCGEGIICTGIYGFYVTSDIRRKENITPLLTGTDFINKTTPVSFNWKSSDKFDIGFVAQDLYKQGYSYLTQSTDDETAEELVDEDGFVSPAGALLTVNYEKIVPLLAAAIKETRAEYRNEIDSLKQEIKELRQLVEMLTAKF